MNKTESEKEPKGKPKTSDDEIEEEIVGITRSGEVFKMKVKRKKGKSVFDAPDYCGL